MGAAICCLTACNECPDKTETVYIHDTIVKDVTCYDCLDSAYFAREDAFQEYIDSIITIRNQEYDIMKVEAINEVSEFRDKAQKEVDSIRFQMFDERDRIILMLNAMKDSHQVVRDNLTIVLDSTWNGQVETVFDEVTGKPKIIWKD